MTFDALVPAGGGATRLGGRDKATLRVGGVSLLDRALLAVSAAEQVIVVGPARPGSGVAVTWARESPPGGGPAAALVAGLAEASAATVVVLAVDYPFVDRDVVAALLDAVGDHDGAALVDGQGRIHFVVGAYKTAALRRAVESVGRGHGASMREVFARLDIVEVRNERAALDVDDPDDLDRARRRAGDRESPSA